MLFNEWCLQRRCRRQRCRRVRCSGRAPVRGSRASGRPHSLARRLLRCAMPTTRAMVKAGFLGSRAGEVQNVVVLVVVVVRPRSVTYSRWVWMGVSRLGTSLSLFLSTWAHYDRASAVLLGDEFGKREGADGYREHVGRLGQSRRPRLGHPRDRGSLATCRCALVVNGRSRRRGTAGQRRSLVRLSLRDPNWSDRMTHAHHDFSIHSIRCGYEVTRYVDTGQAVDASVPK